MATVWMLWLPSVNPLPQPAPTGLLWALLLLTFVLHLVPMNLALGGSIVALVARWRGRDGRDPHARTLASWFAVALPTIIAATVSFGVAPLLFVQTLYGRALFGSSILIAWPWLSVVALVIVAYYAAYLMAFRAGDGASRTGLAAAIAGIFVVVAFIYVNNMSLMLRVAEFESLTANGTGGWRLNADDRTLVPRFLHILVGAVAVAGAGAALLGWLRRHRDPAFGMWAMRYGSGWTALATFANLFFGSWWLMSLPRDVLMRFVGHDAAATTVLMLGIACALVALMAFAAAARAKDPAPAVRAGLMALPLVLVAMIFTRDQVRESSFALAGLGDAPWIEPQWGPIGIFAVLLVAALATIAWMLSALARGK